MVKLILYLIIIPLVVFGMDSVNFNAMFKKGQSNYYQARIMYMFFVMIISFLIVHFVSDFLGVFFN